MSDWVVRLCAHALKPGQRFIFAEEFGGEGEVLTVASSFSGYGTVTVTVEEWDWELEFPDTAMVTLAAGEED